MENKLTFDFEDKKFQETALPIIFDIVANDYKRDTIDDMYETICKYVQLPKEQFVEYYKQAEVKVKEYFDNCELSEEELDNVVGGGVFGNVWKWTKDHAVTMGVVAGSVLFCTVTAGIGGAVIGASALAVSGAGVGAMFLGSVGVISGFGVSVLYGIKSILNNEYKYTATLKDAVKKVVSG